MGFFWLYALAILVAHSDKNRALENLPEGHPRMPKGRRAGMPTSSRGSKRWKLTYADHEQAFAPQRTARGPRRDAEPIGDR